VGLKVGQVKGMRLKKTSRAHIFLDLGTELVISILKGTKRIAEPSLSNKFECNLAQPIGDIDLLWATRHY
jgi:hypothetical protein